MTGDVSRDATPGPSQPDSAPIDRREAIRRVSALLGGIALISEGALWASCADRQSARSSGVGNFTTSDIAFLDEVADIILPETKTPGAKAVAVGAFMALTVTDCYEEPDQRIFRHGMSQLDGASQQMKGASFMSATPEARLAVLTSLDREQKQYTDAKQADQPNHYFRMMKELALLGYFTSEIGCTVAQRYVESPGRYEPCTPYQVGSPAWSAHG